MSASPYVDQAGQKWSKTLQVAIKSRTKLALCISPRRLACEIIALHCWRKVEVGSFVMVMSPGQVPVPGAIATRACELRLGERRCNRFLMAIV